MRIRAAMHEAGIETVESLEARLAAQLDHIGLRQWCIERALDCPTGGMSLPAPDMLELAQTIYRFVAGEKITSAVPDFYFGETSDEDPEIKR